MALTISLSTLIQFGGLALVGYLVWYLYDLFYVKPKSFQKFWAAQGVRGPTSTLGEASRTPGKRETSFSG